MKKALYIHGAFSAFKPESAKVLNLSKEYEVVGFTYDIEKEFLYNLKEMETFCFENDVDFIVGTSLGGLYAAEIGYRLNIPSVLINPCVEPQMSLSKIVGKQKNFTTGKTEELTKEVVDTYPNMAKLTRDSIVFLGMKDDLIDSEKTIKLYQGTSKIVRNEEEDHYWEFFEENEKIGSFIKSKV